VQDAQVFFGLLFNYDQVLCTRSHSTHSYSPCIRVLELLSLTQLGAFAIGDKPKGMPKPIKFILDKFSQGREEDHCWLSELLKIGPKLLKYVPGQKVQDYATG